MVSGFVSKQRNYIATQKANLKGHVKLKHEGVKFPCGQCDYKATQKGSLLTHIISIHVQNKFPCPQCVYQTTWKRDLLKHIKRIHKDIKISMWLQRNIYWDMQSMLACLLVHNNDKRYSVNSEFNQEFISEV